MAFKDEWTHCTCWFGECAIGGLIHKTSTFLDPKCAKFCAIIYQRQYVDVYKKYIRQEVIFLLNVRIKYSSCKWRE